MHIRKIGDLIFTCSGKARMPWRMEGEIARLGKGKLPRFVALSLKYGRMDVSLQLVMVTISYYLILYRVLIICQNYFKQFTCINTLTLLSTLWGKYCFLHLIYGETKVQSGKVAQDHAANELWSRDLVTFVVKPSGLNGASAVRDWQGDFGTSLSSSTNCVPLGKLLIFLKTCLSVNEKNLSTLPTCSV